jgi:glucokinase
LREVRGLEEPAWLAARMADRRSERRDYRVGIGKAKSEICEKAMDMFVSAYGAEAGNLALKVLSVGGLYVGGGIAPRILEKLKDGTFMKAFTDKGRLSQLLVNTPVRVILESKTALIGAAAYAEARAAEMSGISPRAASVKF